MRLQQLFAPAFALVIPTVALPAQVARVYTPRAPSAGRMLRAGDDGPRAALGISIGGSGSARDTLGLLVTAVTPNGPAERAGIQEGDRIASINGVSLRLDPSDAGDVDIGNAMSRRLTRELSRVQAGDEVDLRVYADGRSRSIRVRTADSDSLYTRSRVNRTETDERASLGLGVVSTSSRRDSLGVLVMFVDDSGPAGRAGIEEGNRIAAINDVDLRTVRDDAGDESVASSKVRRLQREVSRLHPGDRVELRVYANGELRRVGLRAARAADLRHQGHPIIMSGDGFGVGMISPGTFPLGLDGGMLSDQVRRSIERAMNSAGMALEGVGRGLGRVRLRDNDDDMDMPRVRPMDPMEPMEPIHIEPMEPSRLRILTPRKVPFTTTLLDDSGPTPMASASALVSGERQQDGTGAELNIAGLRMVAVGSQLASYLGKGSDRGLLVVDVPEWARRALHAGDVVLSLDGRPVRSNDGADDVTFTLPRYREAELDILRDGVHHSVTLPARR